MDFQISSDHGTSGDWLPMLFIVSLVWSVIWLFNLANVLRRSDLDSVTRLTWLIVLIFVPFFGVFLYWFIGPEAPPRPERSAPLTDLTGTPWDKKPAGR